MVFLMHQRQVISVCSKENYMFKKIVIHVFVFTLFFHVIKPNTIFTEADLPIVNGKIYHLSLTADQIAPNIILVGDPDRVPMLAQNCLCPEGQIEVFHRGLRTITGKAKTGLPISIVTTAMGTGSTEIVLNELVILNEIDLQTRMRREKPLHKNVHIIRLGTSGGLQQETELGTIVITEYAVGMDNTGLFYATKNADATVLAIEKICKEKIDAATDKASRFAYSIYPYAAAASPEIVNALYQAAQEEKVKAIKGITVSNSGFFANQGRDISRLGLTVPHIDKILSEVSINGLRVENMEMEASFVCHFLGALGYHVGTICPVICNRTLNTFYEKNEEKIVASLHIILRAFEILHDCD
jgi:uridine phosphorylase